MSLLWKVTQNTLLNKWFQRHYVTKYRSLFRAKPKNVPSFSHITRCLQFCIGSTIIPQGKINVEDDLRKAVEEGETSIVTLMDQLRVLVIAASKEYRACLMKQIELIKITRDGASEELPKFRTLATELSNELNEYVILLKTIGEIAYDQTLISLMLDKKGLEAILKKYKELEILLLHEFEENKRKELELLEVNIANIMSD